MSSNSSYSEFISYSENRLVIKKSPFDFKFFNIFKTIYLIIEKALFDFKFPDSLTIIAHIFVVNIFFGSYFFIPLISSLGEELIMSTKALNTAKLNCNRINNRVSCSLIGTDLFGNKEKVINPQYELLLKATKGSFSVFGKDYYRNDLLVITTDKLEEIYIYTSPNMLEEQIKQLNVFFQNREELKTSIQARKSIPFNLPIIFYPYGFSYISICFFTFVFGLLTYIILNELINARIYIFDKNTKKLIVLPYTYQFSLNETTLDKFTSDEFISEIPLQKIKKIYIERIKRIYIDKGKEKITFRNKLNACDDKDFKLLEITASAINDNNYSQYIAESICHFLQIEPYAIINL